MKKIVLFFCTFYISISIFSISNCKAQIDSSSPRDTVVVKKHSPKKASWLALVPGAGQIYNKKYWKLPIVYGGLGATAFLIYYYADLSTLYKKENIERIRSKEEGYIANFNPDLANKTDYIISQERERYRKNMEICVAACVIVYALSILDACVDAHLFYYDISDNLSLGVKPKIEYNPVFRNTTPSLALIVKF